MKSLLKPFDIQLCNTIWEILLFYGNFRIQFNLTIQQILKNFLNH